MDLLLKSPEEAVFTERVTSLGPFQHGTFLLTVTALDRHDDKLEKFLMCTSIHLNRDGNVNTDVFKK